MLLKQGGWMVFIVPLADRIGHRYPTIELLGRWRVYLRSMEHCSTSRHQRRLRLTQAARTPASQPLSHQILSTCQLAAVIPLSPWSPAWQVGRSRTSIGNGPVDSMTTESTKPGGAQGEPFYVRASAFSSGLS